MAFVQFGQRHSQSCWCGFSHISYALAMIAPTIDHVRSIGVRDLLVVCTECGERFTVPLAAIDLPGETPLTAIPKLRRLACVKCSAPAEVDVLGMGFDPP